MDFKVQPSKEIIPGVKGVSDHSIFESIVKAKIINAIKFIDIQKYGMGRCEKISLNGVWKRKADFGNLNDAPKQVSFDDFDWPYVMVPDNYGLDGELQRFYGPVWYLRTFGVDEGSHYSLIFKGVDYIADVWLNEIHLGKHVGYFAPFQFNITNIIRKKNYLAVKVQDPCENLDPSKNIISHLKKFIKGTMNYHDSRPGGMPGDISPKWSSEWGQSLTTGGITQSVFLKKTGHVRIDSIFVTPESKKKLHLTLVCHNFKNKEKVSFNFFILNNEGIHLHEFSMSAELEHGPNRIDLEISDIKLQDWDVKSPITYELKIEAIQDGSLLDMENVTFGVRKFKVNSNDWGFSINDKPIFIKAVNYIPIQHFSRAGLPFYSKDMNLIREANLNSIGIHAHVQAEECYRAADEKGILVFQDFPLQWTYDSSMNTNPGFRENACKQAADMVYLLYNHPSVVFYCCHNEPPYLFIARGKPDPVDDRDNQVLDALLKETIEAVDGRPFVHLASGIGGDIHVYDGSLNGGSIYNCRKRKAGFVSEFGFWTIADTAFKFGDVGWPPDEDELVQWSSRLSFFGSTATFMGHPKYYETRKEWYDASQLYGAFLAKFQTEVFRAYKSKPYNGVRWHFFSDWWGYAGGGLVDKDRIKKLPYFWYKDACRPVMMIADLKFTVIAPSTELEIPIIAVNDGDKAIELKWDYEILEVNGTRIIAGDPSAAKLGGTGSACKKNHKIALPIEDEMTIQIIFKNRGIKEIRAHSTALVGVFKFKTPAEENRFYTIKLNWEHSSSIKETNWAHFMVGNLNKKMEPGLHQIRK